MAATIPIKLTPIPVAPASDPLDINQLLILFCQQIGATISANVSFFQQGTTFPISDVGVFYNTALGKFGSWNTALGKYIPNSDLQVGQLGATFITADDPANGWVVLDGRAISSVTGLSTSQVANLQTLFGAAGSLPDYAFFAALSGLPPIGSFDAIPLAPFTPAAGVIGAITDGDFVSLRNDTETSVVSSQALHTTVSAVKAECEALLDAVRGATTTGLVPVWRIFCGFP